jgi:hypothetical protein
LAFELTTHKFHGALVRTPQGREETVRPSKFAGKRAARGTVVLKRGRFVEWTQPTLRYDLASTIVDDDDDPPEGDDDPSGSSDGGNSSGNEGSTYTSKKQQGLPLPMGRGGDA